MPASADALSGSPRWLTGQFRYLRVLVQQPRETGSIVPSSAILGRMMAAQVDPHGGPVVELGGGTGALTRQILATGLDPAMLEVVEMNADFARGLRQMFPGVSILETRAEAIGACACHGPGAYQAVISGLPLLAMKPHEQTAILSEALDLLAPGGSIIQFTYSPGSPIRRSVREALGIEVRRVGSTWRNLPPATVFAISRRIDSIARAA